MLEPDFEEGDAVPQAMTIEGARKAPVVRADLDPRWAAFAARDREADGRFFACVLSTGIYCRPSCPARRAKPENVRFVATRSDAEQAGFRACKRCRPDEIGLDERNAALVAEACRAIERAGEPPSLDALAKSAGLSRFHFHRLFKAATGLTPKAYAGAERAKRARSELSGGAASVTEAIYAAGFGSNGRFYEATDAMLGMTPTSFRAKGEGVRISYAIGDCSLGKILVASTARGVSMIAIGDDPGALVGDLRARFRNAELALGDAAYAETVAAVVALVEEPSAGFELPLDIRGTAFQQRVWRALGDIPAGVTKSYAEIAAAIGEPKASRAVAQACGANKLAVVIPCHRVVRADGDVSGYRWGVERKKALLKREGGRTG